MRTGLHVLTPPVLARAGRRRAQHADSAQWRRQLVPVLSGLVYFHDRYPFTGLSKPQGQRAKPERASTMSVPLTRGVSLEEFHDHWQDVHAKLVSSVPLAKDDLYRNEQVSKSELERLTWEAKAEAGQRWRHPSPPFAAAQGHTDGDALELVKSMGFAVGDYPPSSSRGIRTRGSQMQVSLPLSRPCSAEQR